VLSETHTQRNSQNATETVLEGEEMIKHAILLLISEVLFHLEENNMFHNLPALPINFMHLSDILKHLTGFFNHSSCPSHSLHQTRSTNTHAATNNNPQGMKLC